MTELEQMADRAAAAWYLTSYPGWEGMIPALQERWLNVARAAQGLPTVTDGPAADLPAALRTA